LVFLKYSRKPSVHRAQLSLVAFKPKSQTITAHRDSPLTRDVAMFQRDQVYLNDIFATLCTKVRGASKCFVKIIQVREKNGQARRLDE
jgi:hypothetical protein